MPIKRKQIVLSVMGISVFGVMGVAITGPILPAIAQEFNITIEQSWSIFTAFAIPGVFVSLLVGLLADRFGRKAVLLPCLLCYIIGSIGCAMAGSFESLLWWRVVQGLGSGPLSTLNTTITADIFEAHERPRILSMVMIVTIFSSAFAPLLGGILAEVNWRLAFWISLLAFPLLISFWRVDLPYKAAKISLKTYLMNCGKILSTREALSLFFINFMTFLFFYGPIVTYIPILLEYKFSPSPISIGLAFMAGSLLGVCVAFFTDRMVKRFSMRALLCVGFASYVVGFGCIPFLNSVWLFFLPIFFCMTGQSIMSPILSTRVSMLAQGDSMGAAMATNSLMFRLSQAVSPALCALIWAMTGPSGPFFMSSAGCLLLILFAIKVLPSGKKVYE